MSELKKTLAIHLIPKETLWAPRHPAPSFPASQLCPPGPCSMEMVNRTEVSEFFLKGFSGYPALEHLLFPLCSATYLVTLLGNTAIVAVSVLDVHLHTPMYFFLGNLSILDICYSPPLCP